MSGFERHASHLPDVFAPNICHDGDDEDFPAGRFFRVISYWCDMYVGISFHIVAIVNRRGFLILEFYMRCKSSILMFSHFPLFCRFDFMVTTLAVVGIILEVVNESFYYIVVLRPIRLLR